MGFLQTRLDQNFAIRYYEKLNLLLVLQILPAVNYKSIKISTQKQFNITEAPVLSD